MRSLIAVAVLLSACGGSSSPPASVGVSPSTAASAAAKGAPVTLTGTGSMKTAAMQWSGAYRVDYTVAGDYGLLADLDDPATALPVQLVVNVAPGAPKQGTTNVYGLSGSLYLDVVASGAWTITFTPQ